MSQFLLVNLRFLEVLIQEEAKDLTDVLSAGKLPASAKVVSGRCSRAFSWSENLFSATTTSGLSLLHS